MSVLSDGGIHAAITAGELVVDPFSDAAVQPASLDLRLGPTLLLPKSRQEAQVSVGELPTEFRSGELSHAYPLRPGDAVLGATLERITIPSHLVGLLLGRSTMARLFVQVEAAGLLDPGYSGHPTLEITNNGPHTVWLAAGDPICQLMLLTLDRPAKQPYSGRYQGDEQPTPSRAVVPGADDVD